MLHCYIHIILLYCIASVLLLRRVECRCTRRFPFQSKPHMQTPQRFGERAAALPAVLHLHMPNCGHSRMPRCGSGDG